MSRNFELLQRAEHDRQQRNGDLFRDGEFEIPLPNLQIGAGARTHSPVSAQPEAEVAKLVQRLFLATGVANPHLVVFCAVDSGPTRNWVSARAAIALANRIPGKVCLVDSNLEDPTLHEYFGFENHFGLSDALVQDGPVEGFTNSRDNLALMSSGPVSDECGLLLQSERLAARFAELRGRFDYVLVEAPPTPIYSHASLLGRLADGMVMVLEAHSTRRDAAHRAKDDLEYAGVRVLGAVLNNRTFPVPETLYRLLP